MLYQKVRPVRFEEVVGNGAIVSSLISVVNSKDRPHAFLFAGPSGCGKTTLARILATELGADEAMGVQELNAANTRGIDTIRDVTKNAGLRPFSGEAKVVIFDESHQLTKAAQEGLLKVIEDCPSHMYFMFCTTDPGRLITTLKNRCAQYTVQTMIRKSLVSLLTNVCEKEKIEIKEDLVKAIARAADGCPRQALMYLEAVKDIKDIDDAYDIIEKGTEYDATVWDLCALLMSDPKIREKKYKEAAELVSLLDEEPESIRRAILSHLSKKIVKMELEDARDVVHLLNIFSTSTYSGGRPQLIALVIQACIGE